MIQLDSSYKKALDALNSEIQESELLSNYLEEEGEEQFNVLKEKFEPQIEAVHNQVANDNPLQLELLEEELMDSGFEGLFLPRVLGYSVLRGALNDDFKYIRPQEHFKNLLMSIANSSNFEMLQNRIGQTIEVGFAHSSDIWITNLIAEIGNRHVRTFLESLKDPKYTDKRSRHTAHVKYAKQFRSFNFLTAVVPSSSADVKIEYRSIKGFLLHRAGLQDVTSESVYAYNQGIINNDSLGKSEEHLEILMIVGFFFDLKAPEQKVLAGRLQTYAGENETVLRVFLRLQSESNPQDTDYSRFISIVSNTEMEKLKKLLETCVQINVLGYINPEAIETTKVYYEGNRGTSLENAAFRNFIFSKFEKFISSLAVEDFNEYMELNKVFVVYMNLLDNEKFNQGVKNASMTYVKKLLRTYTQKRSKDYQDIKKFVSATFQDLGFLKEKEVKELFKTKRKKATA